MEVKEDTPENPDSLEAPAVPLEMPFDSIEMPFYCASLIIFLSAIVIFMIADRSRDLLLVVFAGIVISMIFLVLPAVIKTRERSLLKLGELLDRVETRLYDLESVRRDQRKYVARIEQFHEEISKISGTLGDISHRLIAAKKLEDEIAQLRQGHAEKDRSALQWTSAAMEYCDFFGRTLTLPELNEDYHSAVGKSLEELRRILSGLGLDVIIPESGALFDDRLHKALGISDSSTDAKPGHIVRCVTFGYRQGAEILRKAEIMLAPESDG